MRRLLLVTFLVLWTLGLISPARAGGYYGFLPGVRYPYNRAAYYGPAYGTAYYGAAYYGGAYYAAPAAPTAPAGCTGSGAPASCTGGQSPAFGGYYVPTYTYVPTYVPAFYPSYTPRANCSGGGSKMGASDQALQTLNSTLTTSLGNINTSLGKISDSLDKIQVKLEAIRAQISELKPKSQTRSNDRRRDEANVKLATKEGVDVVKWLASRCDPTTYQDPREIVRAWQARPKRGSPDKPGMLDKPVGVVQRK